MWPVLTIVAAVVAVAIHFGWRKRFLRQRHQLEEQEKAMAALRVRHEQTSAQVEAQQHAVFNSMVEGVLVVDGAGKVELVNETLRRLFSLTGEVRRRSIVEIFHSQNLAELVGRLKSERRVQNHSLELPGAKGRWLEVNASDLPDRNGKPGGAILVFHDLTRIRQLESTRQEFVANVSHELRTPLSLIKGFVETLLEGARHDPEKCTRFLQTIEKHTDRLTFLIEDLLTISRLESGQIVMNLNPVDLREEAARAIDDLQSRAAEKSIVIENAVPAGLTARADAERLQQVFSNLIENAVKYGRASGRVILGGRALPDKNRVEMHVEDNGPGIPANARDRVFERFYRVDRARSRETGGTGLGLAIVKHIIQAHGGEVWLKSEMGAGTTFSFTLPSE